jgi:hypothetical protein
MFPLILARIGCPWCGNVMAVHIRQVGRKPVTVTEDCANSKCGRRIIVMVELHFTVRKGLKGKDLD